MDTNIEDLLVDIKILTMIGPNGKLYIHNGIFALEPMSIFAPIKRYLYNINRYTICLRIKHRISELENLLKHNHIKDEWVKHEMCKMMGPLKQGISNLQETYIQDSQINATLDLVISNINHISSVYLSLYDLTNSE